MIPIEEFGHDHWSVFGYIETRIVDHGGVPRKEQLRCIVKRHPFFGHSGGDASKFPTRLRGDRLAKDHDDWDCLEDLEAAGLLDNVGTGVNPVFQLTDFGRKVAGQLRGHRGQGGKWSEFFLEAGDLARYVEARGLARIDRKSDERL